MNSDLVFYTISRLDFFHIFILLTFVSFCFVNSSKILDQIKDILFKFRSLTFCLQLLKAVF